MAFTTPWADSVEDKLIFLLIFQDGDNMHEMSKSIFRKKIRKIYQRSSAEFFTQHAKH